MQASEVSTSRSSHIVALSRAAFSIAFLGALRSPELLTRQADNWPELTPMFVYGGTPPGRASEAAVRLAAKSFAAVVRAQRGGLRILLEKTLQRRRLPRGLPRQQYARTATAAAFDDVSKKDLTAAIDAVGRVGNITKVADRLADAIYPPGFLDKAFRAMGRKVGLAGPDRGYGAPRFLLETPVLAMFLHATVRPGESMGYEQWIDEIYSSFGMILGPGVRTDYSTQLQSLENTAVVLGVLRRNQESLRRRLVRAGLAAEYSDGETEVFGLSDHNHNA